MTNAIFETFVAEHSPKFPLAMNAEMAKFAKEQGLSLTIGSNAAYIVREEDADSEVQAIEVTDDLEKTLELFGMTMTPSVAEIDQMVRNNQGEEPLLFTVRLQGNGLHYTGIAYETILNKTLSVWIDLNQLEKVQH